MTTGLGKFGEAWTVGALTRRGYRVVDRNVRYRVGELDIVAYDGTILVIVEVKCRRSTAYGSPESSITAARFRRLWSAAQTYLQEKQLETCEYRVDVMALEVDSRGRVVRDELLVNVEPPT